MTIEEFNELSLKDCEQHLFNCCTSKRWYQLMAKKRPFKNHEHVFRVSDEVWESLDEPDYLEAFDGHPKIGDVNSLKEKYRSTHSLASNEQSSVNEASDEIINELAQLNSEYEANNGFIFIVCATGKSAKEMLDILKGRIENSRIEEIKNAAIEQSKITKIRLEKML